jgi:hypothetical protein
MNILKSKTITKKPLAQNGQVAAPRLLAQNGQVAAPRRTRQSKKFGTDSL